MNDLWSDEVAQQQSEAVAPVNLLREQAAFLKAKTRGRITAQVDDDMGVVYDELLDELTAITSNKFQYVFHLKSPLISGYQYRLFSISYAIPFYPVEFYLDSGVAEEINHSEEKLITNAETELIEALKKIFRAKKTIQVIQAIQAQFEPVGISDGGDMPF